MDQSAIVNI